MRRVTLAKAIKFIWAKIARLAHRFIFVTYFYKQDLQVPIRRFAPKIDGEFKRIESVEQFQAFADQFPSEYSSECLRRMLDFKDNMIVFLHENKVCYWAWFTTTRTEYFDPELANLIPIARGASLYYDSHTVEPYKRNNIYLASFPALREWLMTSGFAWMIFVIMGHNTAPLRAMQRLEFRVQYKRLIFKIGGWCLSLRLLK